MILDRLEDIVYISDVNEKLNVHYNQPLYINLTHRKEVVLSELPHVMNVRLKFIKK